MNKRYVFLIVTLLLSFRALAQMFILNEDFNGASGTVPPQGWSNLVIAGSADDKWHFDNPGDRLLNYPVTEPFAVFDGEFVSNDGSPEEIALESPLFDASTSNYILLNFVHVFEPGSGATIRIDAYNGSSWVGVTELQPTESNPASAIVDLSEATGGITNARIRFIWSGNGSGFWAIDNIRIYASLPLDGGVVTVDSPESPVTPGIQDVRISLGNFGYNTLTSTTINWTADDVAQPAHTWNGSIGFGQTENNITIGSYNFTKPVMIKVWHTQPNGQNDLNPYNDTVSEYLVPPLCGTYTIGGNEADFESFSQIAEVLNIAGITCPVTIIVRNGTYFDQFEIRQIQGSSAVNTVTFESESGDSTQAVIRIIPNALKYEPMILLNGAENISFRHLGLSTGSNSSQNDALVIRNCSEIEVANCALTSRNEADYGIVIDGGSRNIGVRNNYFECIFGRSGAVNISGSGTRYATITGNYIKGATEKGYSTIRIEEAASRITVSDNRIERCFRAVHIIQSDSILISGNHINNTNDGIYTEQSSSRIFITSNRLTHIKSNQNVPEGNSGIFMKNSSYAEISNNYIHTTGGGTVMGVWLQSVNSSRVCFNSVNITNSETQGKSNGILIEGNNSLMARNNIFRVKNSGTPVKVAGSVSQLDFDYNDYYSSGPVIGKLGENEYESITSWNLATGLDAHSLSVIPFYESDTVLAINQASLNNTAVPVGGIEYDIDSTLRNPVSPDFGAKEYTPCLTDAGINSIINPENPLNNGTEQVTVLLQNQGTGTLTDVVIHWSVNDVEQPPFNWNGSLVEKQSIAVDVGDYDFEAVTLYRVRAWTSQPNGQDDCNPLNDTITSGQLAVPLCGNYTAGASGADFTTVGQAVTLLNLSGITCPVTIFLKDGIYYEKLLIKDIPGASETNTVTFTSQNGDSSKATIKIPGNALKDEDMIYMEETRHVTFRDLGLFTGTTPSTSFSNNAVNLNNTRYITFENCYFEVKKESDIGISIQPGCEAIYIRNSRFDNLNPKAGAIAAKGDQTRNIEIAGNTIKGTTEWQYSAISFSNNVDNIRINDNLIENCFRGIYVVSCDTIQVMGNIIKNTNEGVNIYNCFAVSEVSGNRLIDIINHPNASDGTSAIMVNTASKVKVYNNYIVTTGTGPVIGINLQAASQCSVDFNSLNIINADAQGKGKGINVRNSSNISARNNIVSISNPGYPVYFQESTNQIVFDYNDYYSLEKRIGYFNTAGYNDLQSWRGATGFDQHSVAANPFYTSVTDLAINQALLNNSGIPVAGITADIDGNSRNVTTPDIGAHEYSPCVVDAGINAITSPESPLSGGNEEIRVILQNQGTSMLSSVKIYWAVNEIQQGYYTWNGSLGLKANTEVMLGNYNFVAGQSYLVKAWTSEPNNTSDCNNKNDTISSGELSGPLCGTYTIGGSDGDFATFSQVAEMLNSAGITCPVTFLVRDGIYNEKFILKQVTGSSETNTITFASESGDSSMAILRLETGSTNYDPVIKLEGSQYLRFTGIKIVTESTSGNNYGILFEGADNITIENCFIESKRDADAGLLIRGGSRQVQVIRTHFECTHSKAAAIDISGQQTRDISINQCTINGAPEINEVYGNVLVKSGTSVKNIEIGENLIRNSNTAITCSGTDSIRLTKNIIQNSHYGIVANNECKHINISGNRLLRVQSVLSAPDGVSGIFAENIDSIDIINNYIQSTGQGPVLGINIQNSNNCRVSYNSVNITNTDAQGKSKGINLRNTDGVTGRNNIFYIKSSGIPIHVDQNVTNLALDYNNYYNPAGIIGKLLNQVFNNLSQWGQSISGDANSLAVHPYFKSDTIPLPYQRILNGSGIPVAGIRYDIDGKLRHIQAPDMGCMEFFIDFGVLEMISPNLECFHEDLEPVIVYIRQFGDVPFDNLIIRYQLNDGDIHTDTIQGPLEFDFIHEFEETETLETYGDYLFKIWLVNNADDNINNDLLQVWRYSKPSPRLNVTYDNACTGNEVFFSGNATVEPPYYIDMYEWIFGDGDTAYTQNPVHLFDEPGSYQVISRAYSNAGCYGDTSFIITLDPSYELLSLAYDLHDETCHNSGTGTLQMSAAGGTPPYTFYLNGNAVPDGFVPSLATGKYELKVNDAAGCEAVDSAEAHTLIFMDPEIIASPLTGNAPFNVDFDYIADGATGCTWHFPGNITDTLKNTTFTFTEFGDYTIVLEVNSGEPFYCIETDTINIHVDIIVVIEPNSVFTPNGDGHNDYFEVKTYGLETMNVKIFNQWGNRIYEITDVEGKWDGNTDDGVEAADGTYFYNLTARGVDGLEYSRQGTVMLLRHGAVAFPNPVLNSVSIKTFGPLDPPVYIEIFSVFGEKVYSGLETQPGNIHLDLAGLSKGIYFIRVHDNRKEYYVRIIKN
ncbi:MAG: right-handed parallel beta-helix repeat-containing protein [Bacteroidales bacterium]|nr:right-handed parallel beta-helix repeat-containing protein [Bacteroidales bacterium]